MGTFNKLKKNRKSSHLNEKIEFLNKELEKTGVISETPANSTAGIYNTIEFTPGLPSVTSDVPDSTGFSDGSSTQDANGGDESDSDTWENGWNNISDMQNSNNLNGETNRNIPFTPDLSGWSPDAQTNKSSSDPIGSGFGGVATWSISSGIGGGRTIGTITAGNTYVGMVVPDNIFSTYNYPGYPRTNRVYAWYSDSEYIAAKNIADAYEDNKTRLWVTRKVWVPYSMATSHGGPTYAEYTGAKKTTTITNYDGNSETKQWKLKEISVLAGTRQNYISQNSTPDVRTTMFRTGLDDGEYYPGPTSGFMDFLRGALGVGKQALDSLMDAAGDLAFQPFDKALGAVNAALDFMTDKSKPEIQGAIGDFLNSSDYFNAVSELEHDIATAGKVYGDYLSGDLKDGSINNDYLGQEYVNGAFADATINSQGNIRVGDNVVGSGGKPYVEGDMAVAPFEYDFNTNEEEITKNAIAAANGDTEAIDKFNFDTGEFGNAKDITTFIGMFSAWVSGGKYGMDSAPITPLGYLTWMQKLRGVAKKTTGHKITIPLEDLKQINKSLYDQLTNQTESFSLTEGWESPKHTYVDKDQQKRWFKEKDVAPIYPKKAPPKLVRGYHPDLLPKLDTPIPQIKVNAKDLVRSHKLTKVEAQEWVDKIERLNDYIARNPDRLAYVRERYPVSDPHLAALNYKLDMQLAAADEYIEKQFPENIRLYNKVLAATKKSIKLSDPKTFKSENGVFTTFNKLARVQHVDNVYQPKERTLKLKKRGKNSVNRFLSKPKEKTKDDILKDKLAVLDKEMQKTMPDKV
tara:strand:+ start:202 stop:2604 length:2403 start_codon:yes stop_codon:yes gene_type:complete